MAKGKSISHLISKEQYSLHCIKNKIVEVFNPLIIYCASSHYSLSVGRTCFTSKKRIETWNFSCVLVVVIPNDVEISENDKTKLEQSIASIGKVRVVIRHLDSFIQHLNEGKLFFSRVQRGAIILYEKSNSTKLLPTPIATPKEFR